MNLVARAFAFVAALAFAVAFLGACGGAGARTARGAAPEPRLEDAFETPADAFVVLRPQAIKRDALYGALWQRVMRAALARGGPIVSGDRLLAALEGADSVVIALPAPRRGGGGARAIVALRGVRADLEPSRLVDTRGRPSWRPVAANGPSPVAELEPVDPAEHAALFVLPGREWIFVLGGGIEAARTGFAHPHGPRPVQIEADDRALAVFQVRGPTLVNEVRALRAGGLAPIGARLVSVALSLPPGAEHAVVGTLTYADAEAARDAEARVRVVLSAVAESSSLGPRFGWLRDAVVERTDTRVRIKTALPARLADDLPSAGGEPIEL